MRDTETRVRHPFGIGDPREYTDDGEIITSTETFEEAVKEWQALTLEDPDVNFYITGWNTGIIANAYEIREWFVEKREPIGEYNKQAYDWIVETVAYIIEQYGLPRRMQIGDIE